ncbi:lysine exporter LysO family protein [Tenuifilum osseticum]|uniref:lysine exporter LysO family protein n=1 Tax=Tenuifilum osseticum TaxID=3374723 RepID=UPI0034E5C247
MKGSLTILSFFTLGLIVGRYTPVNEWLSSVDYSSLSLYLLMFLVGISIGSDTRSLQALKSMNLKILLIPLATIIGTAIGVWFISIFVTRYSIKELMAVGAGYGYYSLSSIIIKNNHSDALGVVALLSNVIREIITLLLAPLMAIYFGKVAPICSGGATSMDTTLPIISRASGKEYAIPSLIHGIILTILVPFIVTLILSI